MSRKVDFIPSDPQPIRLGRPSFQLPDHAGNLCARPSRHPVLLAAAGGGQQENLGKPGTGKSQVIIRAMHTAIQQEHRVLLAAPVALRAQGYRDIFVKELDCETLHAAFNIPVNSNQTRDVNFALNRYDMVVVDEGSLVSPESFQIVAAALNRLNCCPVVVIAGDKKQQQPLKTVGGKTGTTRSILNDRTFGAENSVQHGLYQQFRVLDKDYAAFLDIIRYLRPTQHQLDEFQSSLVLCPSGIVADEEI